MASSNTSSAARRRSPRALWRDLRRIFGLSLPYWKRMGLAVGLTLGASLLLLAIPLGIRALMDAVFESGDRALLHVLALGLLVLFIVQALFNFSGAYLLQWVGERIVADFRQRVYTHLHRLGLRYFSNERSGDIASRLTNDVGTVRAAVTGALSDLLTVGIRVVGSGVLIMAINWRLGLIVSLAMPASALVSRYLGQRIRRLSREVQDKLADTAALAEETLLAIRVVKAFARSGYESLRYGRAVEVLFDTARHRIAIMTLLSSLVTLFFFTAMAVVFWYGGLEVLAGRLTAGDLVAAYMYAQNISSGIGMLSNIYVVFSSAAGASERLFEILDAEPETQDAPDAVALPPVMGHIRFEDVSFHYDEGVPVLRGVDFEILPGETVALVGPSGAGKTTLLNLLPRFFDPVAGRILIDGHDLRTVQQLSLRRQIAIVSQDVQLFGSSIRENIRYGRLDASEAEIEQAARDANAHAFIEALPEGYDTQVGERGVKLSGGQRQRLAIARALLADARILLLDEATSSLDSTAEALVKEALDRLMRDRTALVIAHRLSTIQDADRILVLAGGYLVEEGTHAALMEQGGLYQEMAARQFQQPAEVT